MKKYKTKRLPDGTSQKVPRDFIKLLNLYYLRYTNLTYAVGKHDLPELYCNTDVYPDYIALYSQRCDYHKTPNTAVAFYQYDDTFDGQDGLYNAIYYNNEKQLTQFKERFEGVRFFISPDYSQLGDLDDIENNYRIKKARVVSIWLMTEMNAIVIPNITFPTISTIDFYLDGLEECSVVAFSTKGYVDDKLEREILIEAVKHTVDRLKLKTIIVYDVCQENRDVEEIFKYAIDKGVEVLIPPNMIKNRNQTRRKKNASK